uniref:Nucleoporin p58/p45 n=1 Tax=Plectus sambesii TaxID=2011161 RepID=A0A914VYQ3_9BILA
MTSTGGFQLPAFGAAKMPAATTSATTTSATGSLFGAPSAPAASTGVAFAPSSTSTIGVGLGGISSNLATSGSNAVGGVGTASGDAKPSEGKVPQELVVLVDELRKRLKENKDLSDQIATTSIEHIKSVGDEVKDASKAVAAVDATIRKLNTKSTALAEEARNDVRQAETVQRRHETIPTHSLGANAQPIHYLHSLVDYYEQLLTVYRDQLVTVESFVASRLNDETSDDLSSEQLLGHLKRMDETFKHVAANAYHVHSHIDDVKDNFMQYRRELYGATVPNPFDKKKEGKLPSRIEGPDPFTSPSQSVLMNMAQLLGRNNATQQTNAAPPFGTSSLFAPTQPTFSGFGASTSAAPVFKPFGATTTTTAASSLPAFTGFGTTTAATTSAPTTTSQPAFNFGNTISSSIGGTLFSGSAAKSFGKPF